MSRRAGCVCAPSSCMNNGYLAASNIQVKENDAHTIYCATHPVSSHARKICTEGYQKKKLAPRVTSSFLLFADVCHSTSREHGRLLRYGNGTCF